jgi:hypothetical protein
MLEALLAEIEQGAFASAQSLVTTISVVGGVVTYFINSRKEIRLRQAQRFNEMDQVFTDFQKTILEHTQLDVAWQPLPQSPELTEDQKAKRAVIFELATSMFEKAYILYQDAPKKVKKLQWTGWRAYIRGYCGKPEYRQWWFGDHHGESSSSNQESASYDATFEKFMIGLFKEAARDHSR